MPDVTGKKRTVTVISRDDGYDPARAIPLIDELTQRYEHLATHLVEDDPAVADAADGADLTPKEQEEMEHDEIRRAVIAAEREAVLALRDTGEIGEDALHAVERDLDLDELRREA